MSLDQSAVISINSFKISLFNEIIKYIVFRKDLHHYYFQADLPHQKQNHLDLDHLHPLAQPEDFLSS